MMGDSIGKRAKHRTLIRWTIRRELMSTCSDESLQTINSLNRAIVCRLHMIHWLFQRELTGSLWNIIYCKSCYISSQPAPQKGCPNPNSFHGSPDWVDNEPLKWAHTGPIQYPHSDRVRSSDTRRELEVETLLLSHWKDSTGIVWAPD